MSLPNITRIIIGSPNNALVNTIKIGLKSDERYLTIRASRPTNMETANIAVIPFKELFIIILGFSEKKTFRQKTFFLNFFGYALLNNITK